MQSPFKNIGTVLYKIEKEIQEIKLHLLTLENFLPTVDRNSEENDDGSESAAVQLIYQTSEWDAALRKLLLGS